MFQNAFVAISVRNFCSIRSIWKHTSHTFRAKALFTFPSSIFWRFKDFYHQEVAFTLNACPGCFQMDQIKCRTIVFKQKYSSLSLMPGSIVPFTIALITFAFSHYCTFISQLHYTLQATEDEEHHDECVVCLVDYVPADKVCHSPLHQSSGNYPMFWIPLHTALIQGQWDTVTG